MNTGNDKRKTINDKDTGGIAKGKKGGRDHTGNIHYSLAAVLAATLIVSFVALPSAYAVPPSAPTITAPSGTITNNTTSSFSGGAAASSTVNLYSQVSVSAPTTNTVSVTTSTTSKTSTIGGVTLTTTGATSGIIILQQSIDLQNNGNDATTMIAGVPNISGTSGSISLGTVFRVTASGSVDPQTLTIYIPFTTTGPVSGASLGTVTTSLTLGSARSITSVTSPSPFPLAGVQIGTTTATAGGTWSITPSTPLAQGTHSYFATATNVGGEISLPSAIKTLTIDTTNPTISISAPTNGTSFASGTFTVSGTASDNVAVASVQVQIDGGSFQTATGTTSWTFGVTGLSDGTHSINARVTDTAGNVQNASPTIIIAVDATAPAAPAVTSPTSPSISATNTPSFSGTAEANSNVKVYRSIALGGTQTNSVTTGTGSSKTSTIGGLTITTTSATSGEIILEQTIPFTGGTTTLVVGAPSVSGKSASLTYGTIYVTTTNPGATASTHTIIIHIPFSTTGAVNNAAVGTITTQLTLGMARGYTSGTASAPAGFPLAGQQIASGIATAGSWTATVSSAMGEGAVSYYATATDAANNISQPTATRTLTIDSANPTVSISSPANGALVGISASVSGTASDSGSGIQKVEVQVDGGVFALATGTTSWSYTTPSMSSGSHNIIAKVTDNAGHTQTALIAVIVDATNPTVSITSPTTGALFTSSTISISGTAGDNNGVASVQVQLDNGVFQTATGTTSWTSSISGLSEGSHTIKAKATDTFGNTANSTSITINVDTVSPTVAISTPTASAFVNTTAISVTGTAADANLVQVEVQVDGGAFSLASGTTSWSFTTGTLSQGSHSVTARALDSAGHTTTISRSFTVDTINPTISITTPADGALLTTSSVSITGTSPDTNLALVQVKIDSGAYQTATGTSGWSYTTSTLSDGLHTIDARAIDSAGNLVNAPERSVIIDTTAPTAPAINSPANGTTVNKHPTVTGTAEPSSTVTLHNGGSVVGTTTASGGGSWSIITSTLPTGTVNLYAIATDAAGNVSPHSLTLTLNVLLNTLPTPALLLPPNGESASDAMPMFTWTSVTDPAGPVTYTLEVDNSADFASPEISQSGINDTSFISGSMLVDGSYNWRVRAVGQGSNNGNYTSTYTLTIDTVIPTAATLSSPANNGQANISTPTFAWSTVADPSAPVSYRIAIANNTGFVQPAIMEDGITGTTYNATVLNDGTYYWKMVARDSAGNNSPESSVFSFTIVTAAPVVTATPLGGAFATAQSVSLTANMPATVYYTIDGSTPTTASAVYNSPISIAANSTLKYFGKSNTGAIGSVVTQTYTIDTVAPTAFASPIGGLYNSAQSVTLSANEPATIYYTTDGSTPTTASTVYNSSISIPTNTTLKFFARDTVGNNGTVVTEVYTIDTVAPSVTAAPLGGLYNVTQSVSLTSNKPSTTIYYTTDGSTPTTASTVYTGPIAVSSTTTLKFFGKDNLGNSGIAVTETYTIDTVAPTISAAPTGGLYNTTKLVALSANEAATIYYTLDGSVPDTSSTVYNSPIVISTNSTLKFIGKDIAGNVSPVTTETYTIDTFSPFVSAAPTGGTFGTAQSVTLTTNEPATIYYTTNGSTPTAASTVYSSPLSISVTTTLKFMAKDLAGNTSPVVTEVYTVDSVAPVVTAAPPGGLYNSAQSVTLSSNKPSTTIYYTLDGTTPDTSSTVYSSPIGISSSTTLKFFGKDNLGNTGVVVTQVYTIDTVAPDVTAAPLGGLFNTAQSVTLSANETATVYYTLDGSTPTIGSSVYSSPISITTTKTLKFIGKDTAGNISPVSTQTYTIDTVAPTVTASPPAGTYVGNVTVTLTPSEVATIYFTLDGSTPTTASSTYSTSIFLSSNTILKFFGKDTAGNSGTVVAQSYNINAQGAATYPLTQMSDTTASSGLSTHAGRQINAETVSATSQLVGKQFDQMTVRMKKTGSPTGTAIIGVFNSTLAVVKQFGTVNVATLPTAYTDFTYSLTGTELYTIQSGDRIGVKFTGGDLSNNVAVMLDTNTADPFDGANTFHQYYDTTWRSLVANNLNDVYMILVQTHANGPVDLTPPTVTAAPLGGLYGSAQSITLSADEPAIIYYTTDGSTPTTASTAYSSPILISSTSTLKYFGKDTAGNTSPIGSQAYTIDQVAPTVTAAPLGSTYISNVTVSLSINEPGTIYYTTDGSTPTASSTAYSAPILLNSTTTLKFIGKDTVGNVAAVSSQTYTILPQSSVTYPYAHMTDTTAGIGLGVYSAQQSQVEFISPSSQLIGRPIDSITLQLKKTGAPTGTAIVGVFNSDLTVKKQFGSAIDVSTLPAAYTDTTFTLTGGELYTIQANDRIGIKFTGGDITNNAAVMTDNAAPDPFDSANSYRQFYTASWQSATADDLYMVLKQTHYPGTVPPVISASPVGGLYNSPRSVTLTSDQPSTTIYYTTNGATPTTASTVYTSPISVSSTTTLKFMGIDSFGNIGPVTTEAYTLDLVSPTVTAAPLGGSYIGNVTVRLSINEQGTIYYTTDGSTPTVSSQIYSTPLFISTTTTIKFNGKDTAGNFSPISSETYTIIPPSSITYPVIQMSDTVESNGFSTYAGRQAHVEFVSSTSTLVGKQIDSITLKLRKVGTPTGFAQVGVFNSDLTIKKQFGGSIDVTVIAGAYTEYTFMLTGNELYTIQSGDMIGIKFTGGDSANNLAVRIDQSNQFDGVNSYHRAYTTAWQNLTGEDMYMILKQTHG